MGVGGGRTAVGTDAKSAFRQQQTASRVGRFGAVLGRSTDAADVREVVSAAHRGFRHEVAVSGVENAYHRLVAAVAFRNRTEGSDHFDSAAVARGVGRHQNGHRRRAHFFSNVLDHSGHDLGFVLQIRLRQDRVRGGRHVPRHEETRVVSSHRLRRLVEFVEELVPERRFEIGRRRGVVGVRYDRRRRTVVIAAPGRRQGDDGVRGERGLDLRREGAVAVARIQWTRFGLVRRRRFLGLALVIIVVGVVSLPTLATARLLPLVPVVLAAFGADGLRWYALARAVALVLRGTRGDLSQLLRLGTVLPLT